MKRLTYLMILTTLTCNAQTRFGCFLNMSRLGYQSLEIDGLVSDSQLTRQAIFAFNYTNALQNQMHTRNVTEFNQAYMKSANEYVRGPGYGIQLRQLLSASSEEPRLAAYIALSAYTYRYRTIFFENEYVQDQPPFYHYDLVKYNGRFNQNTLDLQIVFNLIYKRFCMDWGFGLLYSQVNMPKSISSHRNYDMSVLDYGHKGYAPAISLKLGIML